jgi:dihydrofolate reductase
MLFSSTFLTLDGVMSDPHLWHPAFSSDESMALLADQMDEADALLIGRRTYDEFSSWWPRQDDSVPLATRTNEIQKYVLSGTLASPVWQPTTVVDGADLAGLVTRLRDAHRSVAVAGSASVVRALLAAGLLDEVRIYLDPVVLGSGAKLFDGSEPTVGLELVAHRALPHGMQFLTYRTTEPPRFDQSAVDLDA